MVPSTADMVFCLQHIDAYTECILVMHTVHLSVHRDQIFVLHFHLTQLSPWNFKQLVVFFLLISIIFFLSERSRVFMVTMCDTVCIVQDVMNDARVRIPSTFYFLFLTLQ